MIYLDNVMEAVKELRRENAALKKELAEVKALIEEVRRGLFGEVRK